MGLVNHEQTFDDEYSKDVIARIRDLSPELDEYVITEKYLLETEAENLSPEWLRNRLLCKVVDQLADRGIFINRDTNDLLDAPRSVDLILTLRSKFDQDRFYDFIAKRQELRETLSELIDDDCIDDIVRECHFSLPLDEGWEFIYEFSTENPGILRSEASFNDLITDAFEKADRLGAAPIVDEDDMTRLIGYSKYLADRKAKIATIASIIYSADDAGAQSEERKQVVLEYMKSFESELSHPKSVRDFIDDQFEPKSFVEKRRSFFVSKWNHCIEYWVTQDHMDQTPSDLIMSIMVATLYTDAPDPTHARVYVIEMIENQIDLLGSRYDVFREKLDRMLGNVIIVEGAMNNATT